MKVLILGGTKFVGKSLAQYFYNGGYDVTVLVSGNHPDKVPFGVEHIFADRHNFVDMHKALFGKAFDYIIDASGYTQEDVFNVVENCNWEVLKKYVFISSSAVYADVESPIKETAMCGENENWGEYGIHKREAEEYLLEQYEANNFPVNIIRPAYIYGAMNNLYREAFVFDCLEKGLPIVVPGDGHQKIQFIHISDVCRQVEALCEVDKIGEIYNSAEALPLTFNTWLVHIFTATARQVAVLYDRDLEYSDTQYFPFRNISYYLDTTKMDELCPPITNFIYGAKDAYEYYLKYDGIDNRKSLLENVEIVGNKIKEKLN